MFAYILLAAFLITLIIVAHKAPARDSGRLSGPPTYPSFPDAAARPTPKAAVLSAASPNTNLHRYRGLSAATWAARYRHRTRQVQQLRRILFHRSSVFEAINLAAATYGHANELWRKARCETGGTYSPRALNSRSHAAGLFQFLGSTWRSTPYGRFSVFSPYASALAAGWMHSAGRGSEWVCQ